MNFVEELRWRGMIHDIMPGTEEQLKKEMTAAYVGIDPTAESLHIGHLVSVMLLKHLQLSGHKPIVLIGGATGMIGDPSGKSEERNLISEEAIRHNQEMLKKQLSRFLDFGSKPNGAMMVNNYDWMKEFSFLGFIRDVGKHISVSYMLSKDSVQKRLESGLSFTEFSYQLVQGYDFLHLYLNQNCKLQMGGSDQWGNIVTGTELIRRKTGGEAFALTCPLITKADGAKFGKTESGNVWLDPRFTSPYKFYQFWLNVSDQDAEKYIKIFTLLTKSEIERLIAEHAEKPHERLLQKTLAKEVTVMVHSKEDFEVAVEASEILFGKGTTETLSRLDEETFLSVFDGVPVFRVDKNLLEQQIKLIDLLTEQAGAFPSKGDLKRNVAAGGVSLNKQKIDNADTLINSQMLINGKYLLVQKGKKNYQLVIFG
jgi:tyrosyl-tRNA synthetase